jgi:hypothetical protein
MGTPTAALLLGPNTSKPTPFADRELGLAQELRKLLNGIPFLDRLPLDEDDEHGFELVQPFFNVHHSTLPLNPSVSCYLSRRNFGLAFQDLLEGFLSVPMGVLAFGCPFIRPDFLEQGRKRFMAVFFQKQFLARDRCEMTIRLFAGNVEFLTEFSDESIKLGGQISLIRGRCQLLELIPERFELHHECVDLSHHIPHESPVGNLR